MKTIKRALSLVLCITMVLTALPMNSIFAVDSKNLVTNPGFESYTSGWTLSENTMGFLVDDDPVYEGSLSLKLSYSMGVCLYSSISQLVPVEAEKTYDISMRFLSSNHLLPSLILEWRDINGEVIGERITQMAKTSSTTTWVEISTTLCAPTDAVNLFIFFDNATKCSIWVDAFCVKETHFHNLSYVDAVAATCSENGAEAYYACECGGKFADPDATTEIKAPVIVPATGHADENGDEVCDNCEESLAEPELPVEVEATNVNMGNNLDIMFAISQDAVSDWTGHYAVVTKEYADGREVREDIVPFEQWTTNAGFYVVTAENIATKEMNDEITVVFYDANGNAISDPFVQSMRNYAMTGIEKAETDLQKRLFVDMLNYGAAAQINFNYGTDDLATALLTPEQAAYGTNENPALENKYARGTYHGASNLKLESNILFQIALMNMTDGMYVKIEYIGHTGRVYSKIYDASNLETMGFFKVANIDTMVVADARQPINIIVYNADGSVASASNESIENYCAISGASGLPVKLIAYADSAYAFLHRND